MTAPSRRVRATLFLAPFAVFALLGILWSLASPVFSVPDENAHATKAIAQVRGQVIGYTLPDVRHIVVDLPDGYHYTQDTLCYATHPDRSAECAVDFGSETGQSWFNTWVGAYNPVYYYLVGWPSLLFDGNASIYAMRIASSLVGAALLAWAFLAAASGSRARWMPAGIAFAAAPMGMYLIGAVNPNGAELAAAVAVWAGVLGLLETYRVERAADRADHADGAVPAGPATPLLSRTALWAGVTVASIVLVNARALGPLWLVIIVALCFLASGWLPVKRLFTTASSYWWLGAIAVGGLFSLGWTLSGGSLSNQADVSDGPLVNGTFLEGFGYVIRLTPHYLQQAIGYFGWFDTPLPVWTYWLVVAALAVILVLAFIATRRRSVLVLSVAVLAAFLVPALVQGYSVHQTGIIWQGRYALFLYVGVVILAAWLLGRDAPEVAFLAPRAAWVTTSLLGAYGVLAFVLVLVRYVIAKAGLGQMFTAPQWQPPLGWMALTAGYALASLGLVALVGLTTRWILRRESIGAPDDEPRPLAEAPTRG
ncbi:DUF2142 domain-containing protein [Agromyces mariniharenae]|uniref:DUF2142 domain-containing protein n=1 Tax=Agromyces mariniharenae TaxID=2604423 RepID=A0A5S4V2S1_9MICO|nr:DUF2142 domain-containing protein [Agromyces mariniharenae]TYL52508.1 DUF2142 domain-containing protein [Agromyces mariniharenae]